MAIVEMRDTKNLNNQKKKKKKRTAIRMKRKIASSHFTGILVSLSVFPLKFGEETLILF